MLRNPSQTSRMYVIMLPSSKGGNPADQGAIG